MSPEIEIKPRTRSGEETALIYAPGMLVDCAVCAPIMGDGYPLWGLQLHAVIALHTAHRTVEAVRDLPVITEEDVRWFGVTLVRSDGK